MCQYVRPRFRQESGQGGEFPAEAAGRLADRPRRSLRAVAAVGLTRRWVQLAVATVGIVVLVVVAAKSAQLILRVSRYESPLYTYQHDVASADSAIPDTPAGAPITGGTVYRGAQYREPYQGAYFFGDFLNGWVSSSSLQGVVDGFRQLIS